MTSKYTRPPEYTTGWGLKSVYPQELTWTSRINLEDQDFPPWFWHSKLDTDPKSFYLLATRLYLSLSDKHLKVLGIVYTFSFSFLLWVISTVHLLPAVEEVSWIVLILPSAQSERLLTKLLWLHGAWSWPQLLRWEGTYPGVCPSWIWLQILDAKPSCSLSVAWASFLEPRLCLQSSQSLCLFQGSQANNRLGF